MGVGNGGGEGVAEPAPASAGALGGKRSKPPTLSETSGGEWWNLSLADHLKIFKSLNSRRVKYLVIGGYAVIAYGVGRLTKDVDLFVPPDVRNAERLLEALKDVEFGTAYLITAEGLSPSR